MQDLGSGIAFGLNDKGQVVGGSPAFLWENGVGMDLNTLVCPGTSLQLAWAADINERGEIVGQAYDPSSGDTPGFLATPGCDGDNSEDLSSEAEVGNPAARIVLPENVRKLLQRRRGLARFGLGG
jgi:probable HAF family extracellular repeat protein